MRQGIVVGVNQIPIDQAILDQIPKYGFDKEYTQKCIEANKHNPATTTYYLLLQKYVREGGNSVADLSSDLYEPKTIGMRLHTIDEPSESKTDTRNNSLLSQGLNQSPDSNNKLRILESTGGSSSKDHDISSNKESLNNTMLVFSHKNPRNGLRKMNQQDSLNAEAALTQPIHFAQENNNKNNRNKLKDCIFALHPKLASTQRHSVESNKYPVKATVKKFKYAILQSKFVIGF
jgi:5'-AMP-activated protein kinase catalytic alpha subunit